MKDLLLRLILDQIYKHAFYVCATWNTQAHLLKTCCSFNTKPYCSDNWGYQQSPQTLVEIYGNIGVCGCFSAAATRKKISGCHLTIFPHVPCG